MKHFFLSHMRTVLSLALSLPAFAHGALPGSPINNVSDVTGRVCSAVEIIWVVSIITGVVFIILAAYRFMLSGGDPKGVGEAKQALIYGIVGIAVALLATGAPNLVSSVLSEDGSSAGVEVCP